MEEDVSPRVAKELVKMSGNPLVIRLRRFQRLKNGDIHAAPTYREITSASVALSCIAPRGLLVRLPPQTPFEPRLDQLGDDAIEVVFIEFRMPVELEELQGSLKGGERVLKGCRQELLQRHGRPHQNFCLLRSGEFHE